MPRVNSARPTACSITSGREFSTPPCRTTAEYTLYQQPPMLQPPNGMDEIPKAFEKQLAGKILYGAEITEIRKTAARSAGGLYRQENRCQKRTDRRLCHLCDFRCRYCAKFRLICPLPFSVLPTLYPMSIPAKSVWRSNGVSGKKMITSMVVCRKPTMDINQIIYPSQDIMGKGGVLWGYYNFNEKAVKLGNMSPKEREALALEQGGKIHPQYKQEFASSFSLAWQKIPYNQGGWANWSTEARNRHYKALTRPDDDIYFAGEHVSYLTAWMAGALESARMVVGQLHKRVSQTAAINGK